MKITMWIKTIGLLLLVISCAGALYWNIKVGETPDMLILYGNVDIREVNLAFRVSGRVLEVNKDEGDKAKAGEVVARIDPEPYQRQVEQSQSQLAALQAEYERLKNGYQKQDIEQARASEREMEAAFADAQSLFERQRVLASENVISQQEYVTTAARFMEEQAKLNSAKQLREKYEAGYRPEDIEKGRADVDRASAALNMSKIELADTELKAPSDGTILTRALEPGAIVQAGTTVLTLSLDKPVWVRAYVDEVNLGKVVPGEAVQVFCDSQPNHPYEGQIGFVSPRAEFTPKSVESPEMRTSLVYRLRIVVKNPDKVLRQGMPVTVHVKKMARL